MEYSKEFKNLLNVDLPDGYIGHGNPNAQILILGQEPGLNKDSEQYVLEIENNKYQWQVLTENGTGYESIDPEEIQFGLPLWPWANQRFLVRSETKDGKIKGKQGTAKTWYNYQKLVYRILDKETICGSALYFHQLSFHTDMSAEASKRHGDIEFSNAKESVKKRAEKLFSLPFFRKFPIVIAPVGHFPRDIYGDSYFHDAFGMNYCPNESEDWININVREDSEYPQLLIHCKQIAYASNHYLDRIAEIVKKFAKEHSILLTANTYCVEEHLSTKITTDKEIEEGIDDGFGGIYSPDGKRLLLYNGNAQKYTIKSGTEVICECAFMDNEDTKEIIIPDSVISIGRDAFSCLSLEKIAIPKLLKKLHYNPFWGSPIKEIECHSPNFVVKGDALYSSDMRKIVACFSRKDTFRIPDSVTSIGEATFKGSSLKEIVIPDSVNSIGKEAFWDSSLEEIVIPKSVTTIGGGTFGWCNCLKKIVFQGPITSIEGIAFWGCASLKSIVIPASVLSIGDKAFCGCKSLKRIMLPDTIKTIDSFAFLGCDTLEILIPIGSRAKFEELLPEDKDKLVEME